MCSHASGARPWEIRALPGAGFQRWAGLCGGQKLALLEGESPAPLKHMATREASRGAAQAKAQGRRAGRLLALLPVGGRAQRVREEPRMEEARYPGVQLCRCWLPQVDRCSEEFAAASPVPGRVSVCSHTQGLAGGLVCCAQRQGSMTSSLVPTFLEF